MRKSLEGKKMKERGDIWISTSKTIRCDKGTDTIIIVEDCGLEMIEELE